jgi:hypothetical protein
LLSLAIILLFAVHAAPLAAQESGEAQALLEEARLRFARSGDAVRALELFRRSYQLEPSWQASSGIALMHEVQGDILDAIAAYERLLAEFGDRLDEDQRARVQRRVDRLVEQTGLVVIDAPQPGASVALDGKPLGVGPLRRSLRVMPGPHVVIGTLAGHAPRSPHVEVAAGQTVEVDLRLDRIGVRVEVEERREVRPLPVWLPWVTLGAGALLAGGGAFALVDSRRDIVEFNDSLRAPDEFLVPQPRADDPLLQDAHDKETAGVALCVIGGTALVGGVVMVLLNQPRLEVTRGRPAVEIGPRSVSLRFDLELF